MTVEQLHLRAMELADVGFIAKSTGKLKSAIGAFAEALKFESEAAILAKRQRVGEPTEAVLCRSAASLAYNAMNMKEAEKFVGLGLSGNPPEAIAEELRNLYEDINFSRHLSLQGQKLASDEVQMVIDGNSTGYGFARSREVLERIDTIKTMTIRTAYRKMGKPFSDNAKPTKDMDILFDPYMSVARAASYAFTLRFGELERNRQKRIGGERADTVVSELVANLMDFADGNEESLRKSIKDPGYLRNFWALSRELAPDGKRVKLVGLTAVQGGKERFASLNKPRSLYVMSSADSLEARLASSSHTMTVTGKLSAADVDTAKIKLRPKGKVDPYKIVVPDGLGDIVRKYFDQIVKMKLRVTGKTMTMLDIQPVE